MVGRTPHSTDVRREVVFQHIFGDAPMSEIEEKTNVSRSTQKRILERFTATGSLATWGGQHAADPPNKKMTAEVTVMLRQRVIADPTAYGHEHRDALHEQAGVNVHLSNIYTALHHNGLSHQQVGTTPRLALECMLHSLPSLALSLSDHPS